MDSTPKEILDFWISPTKQQTEIAECEHCWRAHLDEWHWLWGEGQTAPMKTKRWWWWWRRDQNTNLHISTLFFFKVAMPSIKVWQKNAELIRWIQRKRTAFLTIQSHYWYLAMPVNQWGDCLEFSCQSCFRCPSQMNLLECPSHNSPPRIFLQTNILVSMPFSPTAFSPFLHLTAWKSHVHARSPGPVLALFPGPPVWCICLDVGLSIMIKWPFAREACSNAAGAVLSSACKRCCVKSAVNIGWSWSS